MTIGVPGSFFGMASITSKHSDCLSLNLSAPWLVAGFVQIYARLNKHAGLRQAYGVKKQSGSCAERFAGQVLDRFIDLRQGKRL